MRNVLRIFPFCNKIAEFWQTCCPDFRFWQVIVLLIQNMESAYFQQDPFYAEEADWEAAIQKAKESMENNDGDL